MNLDELKLRHDALLAARYSGTRSVSYDGKTVNYGTDAELAAAIGDVERRIAKLERGAGRVQRPFAVKDL
ncbi:hypothetical protein PM03_15190 [Thalassobacter stenotrophicus]|uniref:phage head-tail joining protein n=1 Tax=Thalassobacter stenotrophicus TaxID=266809 RepID=UPI00051FEDD9|nr:hypothetical protein [Thalassobacter stenotrophicus]KGK78292.1 hypothetical protein PM03_15190 [Thalassobacter stenotrophicus]